ncbi:hypothetical protein N7505_007819 [Penicillium chrysogenum]|uniref:Uncharacterized protein n=1 Tax=Penicillium chrysogenum TaxID=5076 RepID=A0ABQ8WEG8_PENCH|nr:hypothetical protein N7505_007819 [Penicillium chrysogenum]
MSINLSLFVDQGQNIGHPLCRELSSPTESPSNSTSSALPTRPSKKISLQNFLRQFYDADCREVAPSRRIMVSEVPATLQKLPLRHASGVRTDN